MKVNEIHTVGVHKNDQELHNLKVVFKSTLAPGELIAPFSKTVGTFGAHTRTERPIEKEKRIAKKPDKRTTLLVSVFAAAPSQSGPASHSSSSSSSSSAAV